MSNVLVDKQKIDILANAIANKSGEAVTMTLAEMVEAVDGIEPNLQSKTYTVDSARTETITADSGYDGLSEVEVSVPSAEYVLNTSGGFYTDSNVRKWRVRPNLVTDPEDADVRKGWVDEGIFHGDYEVFNAIASGTTVTPTESAQIIGGANYMMEGAVTINPIPSGDGGGGDSLDQVKFLDYDGTLIQSYSKNDFMALTALPANPSHTGLTAQGWNWSLADAKSYLTSYPSGNLHIGQMYITSSGDTEIDIELHDGRLNPQLGICPNGTVEIDWGDNSAKDTVTGTSLYTIKNTAHTYQAGTYTIKLHVVNGSFAIEGSSSSTTGSRLLWTGADGNNNGNRAYQNAIQTIRLGSGIANISTYAFCNCYSLASITIPNNITSIGSYTFSSCYSLASITIPSSVTIVNTNTFYNCYSLTSVTIPSSVTSINSSAFSSCYSLANITIPSSITFIYSYVFDYCYSLANIIIPSSVTNIGTYAFRACYSLTNITIPSNVTSIGSYAFNNCYSLANVTIPSSVTSIGNYAFAGCCSLANITIPNSVTSIGTYAFNGCYSLTSITIPSSITSIDSNVFYNCYSLTNITIPSSVTNIGTYAFGGCYSLANVTIPSSVTNIGTYAFYNCYSLANVTILSNITSIGNYTFYNCYSLTSVTIPSSVTSIGNYAFGGCHSLGALIFEPTTPPTVTNANAFVTTPSDRVVYVPQGTLVTYQSATNYTNIASQMVEMP